MPELKVFRAIGAYFLAKCVSCPVRCISWLNRNGYQCDKLKLAVTKIWAYAGLYMVKSFEKIFQLILSTPDSLLAVPAECVRIQQTTDGKQIHVISAFSEHGKITNKFKTYLANFYRHGGPDQAIETNGFNFAQYSKLLNASILWCSYVLKNQDEINPKTFFQDVKRMMVEKHGDKVYMQNANNEKQNSDSENKQEIFMGHISFDDADSDLVNEIMANIESRLDTDQSLESLLAELDSPVNDKSTADTPN